MKLLTIAVCALALILQADAQTREKGPWWPSQWGPDDQAGASNRITPAKILDSIQLVKTGKVYDIGQVYDRDMPLYEGRTYAMFIPSSPTGGPIGEKNQLIYHDEFLCTEIGQVGTQFDGLAHIGRRMKMADGATKDVFYNGVTIDEMRGPYGVQKLGIEHVKSIVTRGILIDIAGYKGVETLDNSYEVVMDDVRGALKKQGIAEDGIKEGDALFFRYGWSKLWNDSDAYNTNPPGIGMEVGQWVVDKKASMIGSDQWNSEVTPSPGEGMAFPVHQLLIAENGIFNLENMIYDDLVEDQAYEFLFIFTPTRFKGGTGSPGRPIAIR
jgi:kynurenine formamidase